MQTIISALVVSLVIVGHSVAVGQEATNVDSATIERIKLQPLKWQYGLMYSQSVTQGELRSAYDSLSLPLVGYGFAAQFAYYMDPIPVVVGGELGVHFFGARDRVFGPYPGDALRTRLELSTQNYTLPILAYVRFQPNLGTWVFPYVEALGGTTIYSSVLNVRQIRGNGDTTGENTESRGGANWTYGLGTGIAIKTADLIELPNALQRILFDVRLRYLWGTSVNVPHIEPLDGGDYRTDRIDVNAPAQVIFQVGFTIQM
jgi:hypothetical protein